MDIQRLASLLRPQEIYAVPYSQGSQEHANMMRTSAENQFPYLKQHNMAVTMNTDPSKLGNAETFPSGETGSPEWPGPRGISNDRNRVEIYNPKFTVNDLAAEGLHIDPMANQARQSLMQTLTPQQANTLKHNTLDYEMSIKAGQPEQKAMDNTVDSALRGQVFNQEQNMVNQGMDYTPEQMSILNGLRNYTRGER